MRRTGNQAGFSAVELLITLFIAAIFLTAGYQLYAFVVRSGAESALRDDASSLAYQNVRRYSTNSTYVTDPCTSNVVKNNEAISDTNTPLLNPKLTVNVTCPYSSSTDAALKSISLVTATVSYDRPSGTETASHAVYVTP